MQHLRRALASGTLRALASTASLRTPVLADCPQAVTTPIFRAIATSTSICSTAASTDQGSDDQRANSNRLLYRARQRGWLELDLLVGMWTERHVDRLSPEGLKDLETLLNQENPELYKWLTGQVEPPAAIAKNSAFSAIRGEVTAAMEAHGAPAARAADGVKWVNAWQEYKKQLEDAGAQLGGGEEKVK